MMNFATIWAAAICLCAGVGVAAPESVYAEQVIVEARLDSTRSLGVISALGGEVLVCEVQLGESMVPVLIDRDAVGTLAGAGVEAQVLVEDLPAHFAAERERAARSLRGGGDWWADFKPLAAVYDKMLELEARRPDLVEVFEIGRSWEDRPIWAMRIVAPEEPDGRCRPAVLLNSIQHAREWITVMVNMWVAESLVSGYDGDPYLRDLVDRVEWVFVPVLNPDGYEFTWTEERLWRKNRRAPDPDGPPRFGVDLNRNYAFEWGGRGSSGAPISPVYRGPEPFSEPETAALRDLVLSMPQMRAHNDMHSYSEMILYAWGYTDALPADIAVFDALGTEMRERIASYRGRLYLQGPVNTTIYPVSGGSVDWFYGDQGIWSFSYELFGSSFDPPPSQIRPNAEETLPATLLLGEFVAEQYTFRADLNQDCRFDFLDLGVFLEAFTAEDPVADFDDSGEFDFFDLAEFLEAFSARS